MSLSIKASQGYIFCGSQFLSTYSMHDNVVHSASDHLQILYMFFVSLDEVNEVALVLIIINFINWLKPEYTVINPRQLILLCIYQYSGTSTYEFHWFWKKFINLKIL